MEKIERKIEKKKRRKSKKEKYEKYERWMYGEKKKREDFREFNAILQVFIHIYFS